MTPNLGSCTSFVEDNRIMKVTLDEFWMELQGRQEFKLSVVVSVVGIQGYLKFPPSKCIPSEDEWLGPILLNNSTS